MFQIKEINLSETIEVVILNKEARQYRFSDNETTLDKIVLHGISVHNDELVKTYTGKTVLAVAQMKKGYLTLSNEKNDQPIKRLPLQTFLSNTNFITFFKPRVIDIRKCFMDFPDSAALVMPVDGLGFSVPITIYYEKFDPAVHSNLV